jgi:hypothetical protein
MQEDMMDKLTVLIVGLGALVTGLEQQVDAAGCLLNGCLLNVPRLLTAMASLWHWLVQWLA